VTPALSAAPLKLSHLTQVELLLPAIPDDMHGRHHVVTVMCQHYAQQSNDDDKDVEDRR